MQLWILSNSLIITAPKMSQTLADISDTAAIEIYFNK